MIAVVPKKGLFRWQRPQKTFRDVAEQSANMPLNETNTFGNSPLNVLPPINQGRLPQTSIKRALAVLEEGHIEIFNERKGESECTEEH